MQTLTLCILYILLSGNPQASSGQDPTSTTEDPSNDPTPPPHQQPNGTTHADCLAKGNCCAMYTWPGNEHLSPDPNLAPRACAELPDIRNNKQKHNVACFNPLFYSDSQVGIRPDPDEVVQRCMDDDLPCFCSTGSQCIKLSYIQNTAKKITRNETRFCGTLTNVISSDLVTNGCYQEVLQGTAFIREVCACDTMPGGYCNGAPSTVAPIGIIIATVVTVFVSRL